VFFYCVIISALIIAYGRIMTNFSKPRVVLVRCSSYDPTELDSAVKSGFDLLGDAQSFFSPGEMLLLKPNILIGDPPEKSTATHPAILHAVGKTLLAAGARLTYGDSPAFGPPSISANLSGLAGAAESLSIPLADFVHGEMVAFPQGMLIKQFLIAKGALAADGIVCLPKFKTHALMRVSGAVKNLFGCIPGMVKSEFHATLKDKTQFGMMLYDLSRLLQPRLCVMDAVIGMEGNGPRNGTSRRIGLLLFSDDATAMDAVMVRLMALEPRLVPTLAAAENLSPGILDHIELLGEPLEDLIMPNFQVNRLHGSIALKKGLLNKVLHQWSSPRPVIDPEKCTTCGTCVDMCPLKPKALSFEGGAHKSLPVYDYELCIRCYCCQETCPSEAISVKTPLLGKILR
jgi:uncharacterized protein (DUF362 family)/NAD-dependent dihydropyrimidine dehydrogenase PreA subunit